MKHLNIYSIARGANGTEPLSLTLTVRGKDESKLPEGGKTHGLGAGESWKVHQAFAFEDGATVELGDGTNTASFEWKDPTSHTAGALVLGGETLKVVFSVTESPATFDERYFNVHAIRCEVSEEIGATEVYVVFKSNGNEVRFPNAKDDYVSLASGASIEAKVSFPFLGDATVELWDEDPGQDDPLGTFDVAALTDLARAELRMDAFFKVDYSVTDEIPAGFQHVATV